MLKRFLSLALAVLMTLLLCSCDFRSLFGGEQTSSDNVKDDPIVGWIIAPILSIVITVLAVIGIINALNGKAKELPIIGKFKILK